MTVNLYAVATVGILMVASGVVLVWVSSRGEKMAIQRRIEAIVHRIDAHGNVTADVEFVARQVNGTVTLEFHGERVYRFEMDAETWKSVKEL